MLEDQDALALETRS